MLLLIFLIFHVGSYTISPIVIIPGLGGSGLEARIDSTHLDPNSDLSKFCKDKFKDWEWFWVDLIDDIHLECVEYILKLTWDEQEKQCINSPGVEIRGVDFGGVYGVMWLDNNWAMRWVSRYFEDTIDYLKDNFGYVYNDTIRGLTFDFRLSPQELVNKVGKTKGNIGYMDDLQTMIEEQYAQHGEKVTIVGHSQGVAVSSLFLSSFVTQDWKDQYINAFISISGVWDGANEGYGYPFIGFQIDLPTWIEDGPWKIIDKVESKVFQEVFLNWPGVQWMLPKTISQDEVVLITGKNHDINITGKDYFPQLSQHGHSDIADIYNYVSQEQINLPPRVPLHCLYTYDMNTPVQFYIDDLDNPTSGYVTKWGGGDTQVQNSNHFLCDAMKDRQNESVNVYRTTGVGHNYLPRDKRVIDYIASVVVLE